MRLFFLDFFFLIETWGRFGCVDRVVEIFIEHEIVL